MTNHLQSITYGEKMRNFLLAIFALGFLGSAVANAQVGNLTILEQPKPIINCAGTNNNELSLRVGFAPDENDRVYYQWFKRTPQGNVAQTALPVLNEGGFIMNNLNFNHAGIYFCRIFLAPTVPPFDPAGLDMGTYLQSNEVIVNVLSTSVITKSPDNQFIDLGGVATMQVEGHLFGTFDADRTADENFQISYQWFKGTTALVNNNKVAGANSSILSIRNIASTDYDEYYCRITAKCGTVESAKFTISASPSVNITTQPADVEICRAEPASMTVVAAPTNGGQSLSYQWYAGATMLADGGGISGTKTNTISIAAGTVFQSISGIYCQVTVAPGGKTVNSATADLTVKPLPSVTSEPTADVEVEVGKELALNVDGENFTSVQWYKDGAEIAGATSTSFSIAEVAQEDAGTYYAMLTNDCGDVASENAVVTITTANIVSSVINGIFEYAEVSPNPTNGQAAIRFYNEENANVNIVVIDAFGRQVASIANQNFGAGQNDLSFDPESLGLTAGTYTIVLQSANSIISNRFIYIR